MDEPTTLGPLLVDLPKIKREAAKRKNGYNYISVSGEDVDSHCADGYEFFKKLKRTTKLKKQKAFDEKLENKSWLLMYLLGYQELNEGRKFTIEIARKGAEPLQKQIDIFAKDEETVLIGECKASGKLRKRSLQKDIDEFASLKGAISNSIKKHYAAGFKPKIIWMFFTENIMWSKEDIARAKDNNIHIITERELRYFLQIADHLRKAARFQFLAEFLKGQKIPEMSNKKVPAIKGKLGGKTYYTFATTPRTLLKISFVNHRSLNDPEGAPSYQRLVNRTRIKQIGDFIKGGGFFPTNLLINFIDKVRFENREKDEETGVTWGNLYLPEKYRSAWIIDGQHRLYGYAPLEDEYLDQNIVVIAFEKLEKNEEANLFVTINHEQKSVPKTLLDDLEGELKWGSAVPSEKIGAISARLINVMNSDVGDPFYNRVTRQGIPATEKTCLTVPGVKEGLRKSGLLGRIVLRREFAPGPFSGLTDLETMERARETLSIYFETIKTANISQWEMGRAGYLCTNTALQAYLLLLASLIEYMSANKGMDARELSSQELMSEIEEYMDPVLEWISEAGDLKIQKEFKVQFGSGGPKEYYFRLCRIVKDKYSDFIPDGYEDWEDERSEEKINEADRKLKEINVLVQKYIFDTFKELHGTENDAYWEKGVSDKNIKTSAYEKSLDDDTDVRLPLEHYLEFIHYKKIVENKTNWGFFTLVFNIPEPGQKGIAKNVKWMERINELRRIPAHATSKRIYKLADFGYIDFIYEELSLRIAAKGSGNENEVVVV